MEEGSFSLGPECEVLWSSTNEDLGGGQHVEGPERRPSLLVLVIHGQSDLGADGEICKLFYFQTPVTKVVVNLNRRDLMFSLKDNEITTSNIENIISSG